MYSYELYLWYAKIARENCAHNPTDNILGKWKKVNKLLTRRV